VTRLIVGFSIATAIMFAGSASAWATPINYTTIGVVGTIDFNALPNSNESSEFAGAQTLLNMAQGASNPVGCESLAPDDPAVTPTCYKTNTAYDYSGTLIDYGNQLNPGTTVPSTYEYALGKYDGTNAGWILFYLPEFGYTIPLNPANFWTDGTPSYGLSHITPLNGTRTVPDGGATLTLLSTSLLGLGCLRRRLN
jgi:hypothetical protein